MAWYILGVPAPEYRALFAPFFCAYRIAQVLVCTLLRDLHTTLDAFLADLQLMDCMVMDEISDGKSRVADMRDVQNAVRYPLKSHPWPDDSPWPGDRSRQSLQPSIRSMIPRNVPCAARRFFDSSLPPRLIVGVASSRHRTPWARAAIRVYLHAARRSASPRASATLIPRCCALKTRSRLMSRRASPRSPRACSASNLLC